MSKIIRVLYNHVNHIREVPDDMDPQEVLEQVIAEKAKSIPVSKKPEAFMHIETQLVHDTKILAKVEKVDGGFNVVRGDKVLTEKPLKMKDAEAFARDINTGAVVEQKPDILGV